MPPALHRALAFQSAPEHRIAPQDLSLISYAKPADLRRLRHDGVDEPRARELQDLPVPHQPALLQERRADPAPERIDVRHDPVRDLLGGVGPRDPGSERGYAGPSDRRRRHGLPLPVAGERRRLFDDSSILRDRVGVPPVVPPLEHDPRRHPFTCFLAARGSTPCRSN